MVQEDFCLEVLAFSDGVPRVLYETHVNYAQFVEIWWGPFLHRPIFIEAALLNLRVEVIITRIVLHMVWNEPRVIDDSHHS